MRLFYLFRRDDESGISGPGYVAEGVQLSNNRCVLSWRMQYTSIAIYDDIDTIKSIHGHQGKTTVVWDDLDFIAPDGIPRLMDGAHVVNGQTGHSEGSMGPIPSDWKRPSEYLKALKI